MDSPFVQNLGGYAKNAAGLGLYGVELLNSLNTPGGFQQFLARSAQAGTDPGLRSALGQSPFLSGAFGYPVHATPVSAPLPSGEAGPPAPTGQTALMPHFGPLPPETQLKGELAESEKRYFEGLTPEQRQGVVQAQLGGGPTPEQLQQYRALAGPGTRVTVPGPGGIRMAFGQPSGAKDTFPMTPEGVQEGQSTLEALSRLGVRADLVPLPSQGVYRLVRGTQPPGGVVASPADVSRFAPPAAAPAAAPSPSAPPPTPSPAAPLPPGVVPPDQVDMNAPAGTFPAPTPAPTQAKVGYPSPAFGPTPTVATTTTTLPPQRTPASAPAAPTLRPGERVTIKEAPGITRTMSGPPAASAAKADFSAQAAQKSLRVLTRAKEAIGRLRQAGILTDDPIWGSIGYNRARLEYAARASGSDKQTREDALFLLRNLQSTVPTLARGFGEQRTNVQEEQRIREALSFNFAPASMAEGVIDNYIALFQQNAPAGPGGARILGVRPLSAAP